MRERTKFDGRSRHFERIKGQYIDYGWIKEEPQSDIYCLSENTVMLAYAFLSHYGSWRNRYVYDTGAEIWQGLTDTEWNIAESQYQIALEELKMAIDIQPIADAIRYLADNQCCSSGANSSGGAICDVPPAYGNPPEAGLPNEGIEGTDPPPDGFASWNDYRAYKCRAANRLADDLIQTVSNLSTFGGALSVLGAVSLAPVLAGMLSGGALVGTIGASLLAGTVAAVVIGLLIGLLAASSPLIFSYFSDLSTQLDTAKGDLVCELYNATSVEGAKVAVLDAVQTALDNITFGGGDSAIFQPVASGVIEALLGNEVMNNLFREDEETAMYVGTIDCDACNPEQENILFVLGADLTDKGSGELTKTGNTRLLTATQDSNGFYYIAFGVYDTPVQTSYFTGCGAMPPQYANTANENFDIIFESTGAYIQIDAFRCAPGLHTRVLGGGAGSPTWGQKYNITWVELIGSNPFTINVKIGQAGSL